VCLVTPAPGSDRIELLHGCVKATIDGLLDLLNPQSLGLLGRGALHSKDRDEVSEWGGGERGGQPAEPRATGQGGAALQGSRRCARRCKVGEGG
jgi:hypothetical protein